MEKYRKRKIQWVLVTFFIIIFCVLFSMNVFAKERVSVISFGASGNGENDETEYIQKAIDFQSAENGGIVYFPKGIYKIDASKSITLKDNITLEFEDGVVLKAIPNNLENFQIIKIHDVVNVNIIGKVTIQGERQEHLGITGEWGMGISIRGATDVKVENPIISNNWGDGIYIGSTILKNYSENIKIIGPVIDNNRRQGISVISVKNLEIINAVISKTNGTAPQAGIDIEPNNSQEILENIKILNLSTEKNIGSGVFMYLANLKGSLNPVSIYVDSTKNIKDGYSVRATENIKGTINVGGYYHISDKEIVPKPIVSAFTSTSTTITGTALAGSSISVKAGTTVIGTAKTTGSGNYTISIPIQKTGTILSVTAKDAAGNVSKETTVTVVAEKFSDLEFNNWFYDEILYLAEENIVQGFPNGSFQPNKNTTRAEAAKMLATALNIPVSTKKTEYSDLSSGHWASSDIAAVTSVGLFNGYTDGSFKPNRNITRAEMAKVLALAYNLEANNEQVFKDVPSTHWASESVSGISQSRITTGYPDNTFRPSAATSRAEFSVFLARALNSEFR
ncbi:S-layer homology domain-containing protein [Planococcus soli]|uniref:S-layer homology domain-containing protein n=1 Tax=Planococcus soli TaxID=2666072 RepID=UPI00115DD410|nr:S-layer homology domain-containing protein [Planococcus soli]